MNTVYFWKFVNKVRENYSILLKIIQSHKNRLYDLN